LFVAFLVGFAGLAFTFSDGLARVGAPGALPIALIGGAISGLLAREQWLAAAGLASWGWVVGAALALAGGGGVVPGVAAIAAGVTAAGAWGGGRLARGRDSAS
jgi:hypothetical protein